MAILEGEEKVGSAALDLVSLSKPVGGKLVIKKIFILPRTTTTSFALCFAVLGKIEDDTRDISLGERVTGQRDAGARWKLDQTWYEGWKLNLYFVAQAGETWYYLVEYDIIEEPKKKLGWGQA